MLRFVEAALIGAALVGCAPHPESDLPMPVVDLREAGTAGGGGEWQGDTLIVDTPCLELRDLSGFTLDEACNVVIGGRAHTGEDRLAATVFDDAACLSAAGFLPPPGKGGEVVLPGGGLGVILRCAIDAEPS